MAVVFHGEFAERIARIRGRVAGVGTWLWVDDGTGLCPEWATAYEDAAAAATSRTAAPWGRDGDDLFLLYTGGTTGMPKGVTWRQDDLFVVLNAVSPRRYGEEASLDAVRSEVTMAIEPTPSRSIVKGRVAPYKAAKRALVVPTIGRATNGKMDYARWRTFAREQI